MTAEEDEPGSTEHPPPARPCPRPSVLAPPLPPSGNTVTAGCPPVAVGPTGGAGAPPLPGALPPEPVEGLAGMQRPRTQVSPEAPQRVPSSASSICPSQSSSRKLQVSTVAGPGVQLAVQVAAKRLHCPRPQLARTPSSTSPLQLLSRPSQSSTARG